MRKTKVPVAILVRVSTVKQETSRQISELRAYAKAKGYDIVEICRETISGNANGDERHGLRRAAALAIEGKVKKVLVHEISRLARRNSVAHHFVETLEECGVSLYWHAQGIETLLPNGKRNPAAGIMLALLAEMARSEGEVLRERIKSGLALAGSRGVILGRPKDTNMVVTISFPATPLLGEWQANKSSDLIMARKVTKNRCRRRPTKRRSRWLALLESCQPSEHRRHFPRGWWRCCRGLYLSSG